MVLKKTWKKKPKTRRGKRRFRRTTRPQGNLLKVPFPPSFLCRLKYSDYVTVTQSAAGIPGAYQFRLNSLFDPDLTGSGHQPYFYDQLTGTTKYAKYTVYGCRWRITASSSASIELLTRTSTIATVPTVLNLEDERPRSQSIVLNAGADARSIKGYISMNRLFGVARRKISDDPDFTGDYNTSPTNKGYLNILTHDLNQAGTSTTYLNVELQFYCRLHELTPPGQS